MEGADRKKNIKSQGHKKDKDKRNASGENDDDAERVCRICYTNDANHPGLTSLCSCRGSMGHVHVACLERWINKRHSARCEVCGVKFNVIKAHRHGLVMSVLLFIWEHAVKFVASLLIFSSISPFALHQALVMNDLVTYFNDEFTIAGLTPHFALMPVFFFVGTINLTIFLLSADGLVRYFQREWRAWKRANCELRINTARKAKAARLLKRKAPK